MKTKLLILTLLAVLLVGLLGPATAPPASAGSVHSHPAFLDKTRFVLHMGAAYFAFHHFVWNRFKSGAFKSGAPHRVSNIIKAGIALLFAYHEVHVAYNIAKGSKSKTLQLLISPINKLQSLMSAIGAKFKKGQYSDSDVTSINSQATSVQSTATANGYGFKDRSVPVPGAS